MGLTSPSPFSKERDPSSDAWRETRWYLEYSSEITLDGLKAHLKECHCPFLPEKLRQTAQEILSRYKERHKEEEGIVANLKRTCEKVLELIPA